MITLEKLKEYEKYHGFYDGFYLQKVKNGINIISDDEWYLIAELVTESKLVKEKLGSKEFAENVTKKINLNCENEEVKSYLKTLIEKDWS